eukprot:TRINITY_DN6188_c0_g1_i2.p1 TRINITY_DN6188_c0_g1~~TRINITY_DN6188_c0_g1_i2.p1  ORF type:complete len:1264 (+),score=201.87 TRINITY_DN6188_c0_g1_i2:63-3854(+)
MQRTKPSPGQPSLLARPPSAHAGRRDSRVDRGPSVYSEPDEIPDISAFRPPVISTKALAQFLSANAVSNGRRRSTGNPFVAKIAKDVDYTMASAGLGVPGLVGADDEDPTSMYLSCSIWDFVRLSSVHHPESRIRRFTSILAAIAACYTILAIPFEIAFRPSLTPQVLIVDAFSDAIFLFHLFLSLHTAYYHEGLLVTDLQQIRQKCLRSKGFVFHAIASIPIDWIALAYFYPSYYSFFFRLPKLTRFQEILAIFRGFEKSLQFNPGVVRVLKMLFFVIIFAHWLGCLWFLLSVIQGSQEMTWAHSLNLIDKPITKQYIYSVYFCVTVMTTVGFGDITPVTDFEHVFVMFVMLSGASLYAAVSGNMANIMASLDQSAVRYRQKVEVLQEYMKYRGLPEHLKMKILQYYEVLWSRHGGLDENVILKDMPGTLRSEVSLYMNKELVRQVGLFKDCDAAGFLNALVVLLRPHVAIPGEYVIREGDLGHEMYFVKRGTLEVLSEDGNVVFGTLKEDHYFGEIALLFECKRTASIRASSYCDLLVLSKKDFDRVLQFYPGYSDKMRQTALDLIKQKLHNVLREAELAELGTQTTDPTAILSAVVATTPIMNSHHHPSAMPVYHDTVDVHNTGSDPATLGQGAPEIVVFEVHDETSAEKKDSQTTKSVSVENVPVVSDARDFERKPSIPSHVSMPTPSPTAAPSPTPAPAPASNTNHTRVPPPLVKFASNSEFSSSYRAELRLMPTLKKDSIQSDLFLPTDTRSPMLEAKNAEKLSDNRHGDGSKPSFAPKSPYLGGSNIPRSPFLFVRSNTGLSPALAAQTKSDLLPRTPSDSSNDEERGRRDSKTRKQLATPGGREGSRARSGHPSASPYLGHRGSVPTSKAEEKTHSSDLIATIDPRLLQLGGGRNLLAAPGNLGPMIEASRSQEFGVSPSTSKSDIVTTDMAGYHNSGDAKDLRLALHAPVFNVKVTPDLNPQQHATADSDTSTPVLRFSPRLSDRDEIITHEQNSQTIPAVQVQRPQESLLGGGDDEEENEEINMYDPNESQIHSALLHMGPPLQTINGEPHPSPHLNLTPGLMALGPLGDYTLTLHSTQTHQDAQDTSTVAAIRSDASVDAHEPAKLVSEDRSDDLRTEPRNDDRGMEPSRRPQESVNQPHHRHQAQGLARGGSMSNFGTSLMERHASASSRWSGGSTEPREILSRRESLISRPHSERDGASGEGLPHLRYGYDPSSHDFALYPVHDEDGRTQDSASQAQYLSSDSEEDDGPV